MNRSAFLAALPAIMSAGMAGAAELEPDPTIACGNCGVWNAAQTPFRIFGDTYYVGPAGLSALLIDGGEDGLILVDGGLPQSAAVIAENMEALGFSLDDVKLIVNSHAHFDHAGGIAALQRASGATVALSPRAAEAFASGCATPDDPQYLWCPEDGFPVVTDAQIIADGETLTVGSAAITAHFTPGHTPGGTSWTWESCEGENCLTVAYVDSISAVSHDGYRFSDHPETVAAFRDTMETVAALPCDIFLTTHPNAETMAAGRAALEAGAENPFIDPDACRVATANAEANLAKRLVDEARAD